MDSKRKTLLGLHTANILFAGTGLFSKSIPLSAVDITALRCLIAAAALLGLVKMLKGNLRLQSLKDYGLMVLMGLLMCFHWVTFFHAMQVSTVAVGMLALYTYPVMTVFLEPLWQRQLPRRADVLCGFVVLIGVYLIIPDLSLKNSITLGVVWGMVSAFLFTVRNVLQRHYLTHYRGDTAMFYQALTAGVAIFPFMQQQPADLSPAIWAQLFVLALFFTAIPHSLFTGALRHFKAKSSALIACLQPVYGVVLACIILREVPSVSTILGGAVIVSAAVIESNRS